ncbi:sigma-54-dependent transcriptional regulator [Gemmatimonadota bacterium]
MAKILIAEDDLNTLQGLETIIAREEHEVLTAADGREAYELMVAHGDVEVLLTDLKMPHLTGLELSEKVREGFPETQIIVMTAFGTVDTAVRAMKDGVFDYLTKPVDIEELLVVLGKALRSRELLLENLELRGMVSERYAFENIIAVSGVMQNIFRKIRKVAPTGATVLIEGESGTGKELIARAIHYNSPRERESMVEVNCASIPATLIESELFGHEKGAFTGAYRTQKGKFEVADGGTIFLDEISLLSPDLQGKLLRVLQERSFQRVGGNKNIEVDVRVVAATNRDLKEMVDGGEFREDLYYRLNVIPIHIPPLRERPEDITALVTHFMKAFSEDHPGAPSSITQGALDELIEYDWPGNVRELENAIESAIVTTDTDVITEDHLNILDMSSWKQTEMTDEAGPELSLKEQLDRAEKKILKRTLEQVGGNRTRAAEVLGLSTRAIRYKIKQYEL